MSNLNVVLLYYIYLLICLVCFYFNIDAIQMVNVCEVILIFIAGVI